MMQQANNSVIPSALQALMVLKQQAQPVAPGPGGQPIPTVAEQTVQQAMQPVGNFAQQPVMQGIAQNTATGNAIQMQQQQEAQQQLMRQLMAQQRQQPMMAEGGIASLNANINDYADGGVVGYNGEEDSYVDPMGGVYGATGAAADLTFREALGLGNIANRKVLEEIEAIREGKRPTTQAPEAPASFNLDSLPPQNAINFLVGQLSKNQNLSERDRTAFAQEIQRQYVRLGSAPPAPQEAAPQVAPSQAGISAVAPQAKQPTIAEVVQEVSRMLPAADDKNLRSKIAGLEALQAQRTAPDSEIERMRALLKEKQDLYEQGRKAEGPLGELMSVLGSISERGDGLTGLRKYRKEQETAALAQIDLKQNLADKEKLLRDKYRADQENDIKTSIAIEQDLRKNAEERQKLLAQTATSAFTTQAGMRNVDVNAEQKVQNALMQAETAARRLEQSGQPKPVDRAAILEKYADNWEKMEMLEKMALAKQGVTTLEQYVQMRDRMASGVSAPSSQGAPAIGTVMQGYRFKGGNPADKNNWEKV